MQTLLKTTRAYTLLQAEKQNERFSHAYLLLFDDARNLRFALKTFSKLFFPPSKRTETLIEEESFSDCLFFPQSEKKFTVEDAEKIAEECLLQPVEGEKKLFVICDFAEATAPAQNKLLKLLEEPPKGVFFLLGATSVFPVLSTVLSRVEKLEILPFAPKQICEVLSKNYAEKGFTKTDFELCAAASGGSLGSAENMLLSGDYKKLVLDAFSLCLATGKMLPALVKNIGENKNKKEFLSLLRLLFRDALLLKTGKREEFLFLKSEKEKLKKIAEKYETETLLFAQEEITKAEREVFFNAVFPQCVEILIAKILKREEENRNRKV